MEIKNVYIGDLLKYDSSGYQYIDSYIEENKTLGLSFQKEIEVTDFYESEFELVYTKYE